VYVLEAGIFKNGVAEPTRMRRNVIPKHVCSVYEKVFKSPEDHEIVIGR